ncbi:MAG: VOC family protein [Patescibacteria group bacterium]|nr:VOC family protein [Patescibacteria group bacterium]
MLRNAKIFSSFSVPDLAAAERFYGETLGLPVKKTDEGLQLGDSGAVFIYPSLRNKPADFTVLNLVVDDVDASVDELAQKGVSMEQYDMEEIKTDEKGVARGMSRGPEAIAWFKDPAGNIISILEQKK